MPESKIVRPSRSCRPFSDAEIGLPAHHPTGLHARRHRRRVAARAEELGEHRPARAAASPISQVLVEQWLGGWKEIEYEVMRDSADNCITVCNMENFDPHGRAHRRQHRRRAQPDAHDHEYQMLRTASVRIISALEIEGGCNVQFALDPRSFRYYVIEVNPRVSRSSALASKATGYPIARVAAKIAIGKTLDEITNAVTGKTPASSSRRWTTSSSRFRAGRSTSSQADRTIGTQMKATGEVMAIDRTFEAALQKAMRSLEVRADTLNSTPADVDDLGEFPPNDVRRPARFPARRHRRRRD